MNRVQRPYLREALPELAEELRALLLREGEEDLAAQVPQLRVVDRCRCGDDFRATIYLYGTAAEGFLRAGP